jgi:hypothetical protein
VTDSLHHLLCATYCCLNQKTTHVPWYANVKKIVYQQLIKERLAVQTIIAWMEETWELSWFLDFKSSVNFHLFTIVQLLQNSNFINLFQDAIIFICTFFDHIFKIVNYLVIAVFLVGKLKLLTKYFPHCSSNPENRYSKNRREAI